jgi:hypothetical protein
MKIRVQRPSGEIETLSVQTPIHSLEGKKLDRIIGADGVEHFFTQEGYYDGWGRGRPSRGKVDADP